MNDIYNNVSLAESLAPAARTSSENGAGVSMQGYNGALVIIHAGNWTDGTHAFEVQESDDDVTYTAVADADLQGSEPTVSDDNTDDQIYKIGYVGDEDYIRVVQTVTGTPATGLVSGVAILRGFPRKSPVS
ncbi:MAG: hypothetical protein PVG32_20075 [Anaerolineales bacterium]|jgi:hypothetical protein